MISEEYLAHEFAKVVDRINPKVGKLLQSCYVKVAEFSVKRLRKRFYYITIYCPDNVIIELQSEKNLLKDIAENMGLIDVTCLNATKLLHDPLSRLKEDHPHLWMELYWIAAHFK
ncbi:hypothetical protein ACE1B6_28870 [Aerosakkonemataceae cyanobacterium BLCC-F154]|uniref:Uncharacterized protein n=1 Tax=Floridaenema fluviatile BLCC-F154 TaxID=3153640 RepID=A0ABV4YN91_9CYAN